MFEIGAMGLVSTMFVQMTWTIFRPAELGPPPDWSLYPLPPFLALFLLGAFRL